MSETLTTEEILEATAEDISTFTPSQIDSALAEIWTEEQTAISRAAQYRRYAKNYRPESRTAANFLATAEEQDQRAIDARHAALPYEAEFVRRGGWSRFFIVNNTGGHVHSSMTCNTCFSSTSFSWLPALSGGTEETMVAEFGEMACTVCFPSAPVMKGFGDGTSALARYSAEEKASRAAEKDEKKAAKLAKALLPDGSEFKVGRSDYVTTIVAAERKISEYVQSYGWYGPTHPTAPEWISGVLVLAEKLIERGVEASRIDAIVERATKKVRKEGGTHV